MEDQQDKTFCVIVDELLDTYRRKNADYGNSFERLYNEFGMVYAYAHMIEKLMRVRSLMNKLPEVSGESMKDSLKDLASYAILTLVQLIQHEKNA